MSGSNFGAGVMVTAPHSVRRFCAGISLPLVAIAAAALLAGCANRDSITVGSVPDDYRTNHPIVISQQDLKIDLPVGAGDRGMTRSQRQTLLGFLDGYDRSAAPLLTIAVPSGSANEVAARAAARDFARLAAASGISRKRISTLPYQAGGSDVSAPIRVSYTAVKAHTDRCGRWPDDLLNNAENKHYANFGCSYQNNLAAQIANPADLIGPRKQTPIDAERRGQIIDDYRKVPLAIPPVNQEVDY